MLSRCKEKEKRKELCSYLVTYTGQTASTRTRQHRDRKRQGNSDGHLLCLSCCSGLYVSVFILLCLVLIVLSSLLVLFCPGCFVLPLWFSCLVLWLSCFILSCFFAFSHLAFSCLICLCLYRAFHSSSCKVDCFRIQGELHFNQSQSRK